MDHDAPEAASATTGLTLKDYVEFLQRGFSENMAHARHQETVRGVGLAAFMALATAIISVIGLVVKDPLSPDRAYALILLGMFLALIGLFGALFAQRSTNRYQRWRHVAVTQIMGCNNIFKRTLGQDGDLLYGQGLDRYRADMRKELGVLSKSRMLTSHKAGHLWVAMMLLVAVTGLICAGSAAIFLLPNKAAAISPHRL